ncbi:MAG: AI-2E family transporter [Acidobacteriaceae bacterium]
MTRTSASRELSRLLTVIVAVVTIAVLYLAKIVLLPLAFAILFAFLLAPPVTMLEKIRLPRVAAILLVICTFGAIVGAIGWTVTAQLIDVTEHLPAYRTNIAGKVAALHKSRDTGLSRAAKEVQHLSQQVGLSDLETTAGIQGGSKKALGSSPARPVAVHEVAASSNGRLDTLHGALGPLVTAFLAVVFTFFMLLQREDLRSRLIRLTGRGHLNLMTQAMDDASRRVSRYFLFQLLVNTTYGLIVFTALHFIGLPHDMLFGALATLLRFIPYIGAPIAALLPTALSLAVFNTWEPTLLIMSVFFCLEVVTANFVEPHVYGKHTGLSSLAVLVAAAFWTLIWGPVGLVLSVPLTVCLVVLGRHVPRLEFLTVLLGDRPPMPPSATYYQRLLASDEHEASEVLECYLKEHSLQDLYDSVLIPALSLAEQDRHQQNLDDTTVSFIYPTTRELVDELGLRREEHPAASPAAEAEAGTGLGLEGMAASRPQVLTPRVASPIKVVCVPVRDEADEIVAVMLTQMFERAGYDAQALSLPRDGGLLAKLSKEKPEVVCLSGLPPFAMAHARRLYRKIREQEPHLKIMIGLWNYTEDGATAAQEISRGEVDHISTTLAEAVKELKPAPARDFVAAPDRPTPVAIGK